MRQSALWPSSQNHGRSTSLVVIEVFDLSDPLRLGQDAVVNALLVLIGVQLERASLAERLVEVDVLLFAQRFDVKFKQVAEHFGTLELDEHEHIFAKRRLEFGHAFGLAQLSGHAHSPSGEVVASRVLA